MLRLIGRRACAAVGARPAAPAAPTAAPTAAAAAAASAPARGMAGRNFQQTPGHKGQQPQQQQKRRAPPSSVPRPADPKPAAPTAAAAAAATAKPAQAQSAPQPPPPSSAGASASGSPDFDAMLSDPRLSSLLSNPLLRKSLESPAARDRVASLMADPARLQDALSNPLLRRAAGMMSPDMKRALEEMDKPEKRKEFLEQMAAPGRMDSFISAVEKKKQQDDAAAAAADARAATAAKAAAAAAAAAVPKPAATSIPAAAAASASIPASSGSSGSGSSSTPPPPPSDSKGAASPEDVLTPTQRRLFRWSDLLLGCVAGFLVWQLGSFLLDRPEALDAVVAAAEEDALIQAKVGSPAKASLFWSGNVNPTHASLVVPISGPNGKATVHARAFYDSHFKTWKLMLLQASVDGEAQKHTLLIPDRFVIKPRYVSPEEAERIRKKYEDMQARMAEHHAKKQPQPVDPAAAITLAADQDKQ